MKRKRSPGVTRFALCLSNEGNPASLEVFKVYPILRPRPSDDPQDIRVIDESGEDYLYPRENFLPLKLPPRVARAAPVPELSSKKK
jgi:hypothetical protein